MKEQDLGVKWFRTRYYPNHKVQRAVLFEEGVLPRLHQTEVTLFTPWGPRYDWKSRGVTIVDSDKEVAVLNFFRAMVDEWQEHMPDKKFRWIFLGADLYGTRINNLPTKAVADYFSSLQSQLSRVIPWAEFWIWSDFDREADPYRAQVKDVLHELISPSIMMKAARVAQNMGRKSDHRVYLVERLAEATLVEERLRPIKVSAVLRGKDLDVDRDLPRLYFLPEKLCA